MMYLPQLLWNSGRFGSSPLLGQTQNLPLGCKALMLEATCLGAMNTPRPIFDPGEPKVIGQSFPSPSSRRTNRIYFVLMLGLTLLGIGCLFIGEYVVGVIMTLVGVIAAFLFARAELPERSMQRRMSRRGEQSSHDSNVA
jgi:hypothetical protein